MAALQGSLIASSSSSTSNILFGAGMLYALGAIEPKTGSAPAVYFESATYRILTFANDVAGGGTRTNQIFLVSFLFPWPHPSFNGGAIVSYTLRGHDGKFIAAETLNHLYGYTKWNPPKAEKKSFSNLAK